MINLWAVVLVVVGSWIGSYGTFILKKGANRHTFWEIFKTKYFWWGAILNGLSIPFYIVALRMEQLSFVYPLVSVSYIWTTLFSVKYLGEKMDGWKYLGLAGVVLGIVLIGIGS